MPQQKQTNESNDNNCSSGLIADANGNDDKDGPAVCVVAAVDCNDY
jgi:hypothetical protein